MTEIKLSENDKRALRVLLKAQAETHDRKARVEAARARRIYGERPFTAPRPAEEEK